MTLGVNRIITGSLQRFEGGQVLYLMFKDAGSLEQIRTIRVPYDPRTSALADSLPGALARLVGKDPGRIVTWPRFFPKDGPAGSDYLEGLGFLQAKDYESAVASLTVAVTADSEFGLGWSALGWAQWLEYSGSGDLEMLPVAFSNLERAVSLEPEMWFPRFQLGEAHRKSGNSKEALAAFKTANDVDPGNLLACRGMSRVYRAEQRYAEGEAILMSAVDRHPDYFEAHRMLALFYFHMDEEEAALTQLNQALALAPDDLFPLNAKGAVFVERGQYPQAREMFERAFAFAPNCDTCSNIGWMLYNEKQFEESARFFELAMEYCQTTDPDAWANWARALFCTDSRRPESRDKFKMAIDLTREQWNQFPGDPEIIGNLIEYHAMIGDKETTRRLIATGDSLASDNGELLYQIGDAYELIGDRTAALRYLAIAIRHGIPVERIQATHELADLVADPRFVRIISAESGSEHAQADSVQ